MTLPENLNSYISAALFVMGAYLLALYVGMIIWTYRDVSSRSRDLLARILATLLVAIFNVPGILVYMLVRPRTTLAQDYEQSLAEEAMLQDLEDRRICPNCHRPVREDYIVCPECHQHLMTKCMGCGRLLDPRWDVCPYCGLYQEGITEKTEPNGAEDTTV